MAFHGLMLGFDLRRCSGFPVGNQAVRFGFVDHGNIHDAVVVWGYVVALAVSRELFATVGVHDVPGMLGCG